MKKLKLLLGTIAFAICSSTMAQNEILASEQSSLSPETESISKINTPDPNNLKVVCNWFNGCTDWKVCCKMIKGGENCANTTFEDANGQALARCSTGQVSNCIACSDQSSTQPMGDYTYGASTYVYSYNMSHQVVVSWNSLAKVVFRANDYTTPAAGRATWVRSAGGILTIYTATASNRVPFSVAATLDSVKVGLDTLFGSVLDDRTTDILLTKWLNEELKTTVAPNPTSGKYTISTQSSHPAVSSTDELILEIYNINGEILSSQKIAGNGKYEFIVPANYASEYLLYRIKWNNSITTGKIAVIKP